MGFSPKNETIEFVLDKIGMSHRVDASNIIHAIGSYDSNGSLLCGFIYHKLMEFYPGYRCLDMHVAGEKRGFTKGFLTQAFHYPFVILGCVRVIGRVLEENERARRFAEQIGFKLDGIERTGIPELGNICLYTMLKSECKFLNTKE